TRKGSGIDSPGPGKRIPCPLFATEHRIEELARLGEYVVDRGPREIVLLSHIRIGASPTCWGTRQLGRNRVRCPVREGRVNRLAEQRALERARRSEQGKIRKVFHARILTWSRQGKCVQLLCDVNLAGVDANRGRRQP